MATYYVRTDGSDSNAGTGPATNQAWQTITKAIGATGIAPGDTLFIAPGVYRGTFTAAFTNPTSEGQRITIAGNPTASLFTGVNAGPIIITNYLNNVTFSGLTLSITKNFITISDLCIYGKQTAGSPLFGTVSAIESNSLIVSRCYFGTPATSGDVYTTAFNITAGGTGPQITNSIFENLICGIYGLAHSGTWDTGTLVRNCIFTSLNTNGITGVGLRLASDTSGQAGGFKIINNTINATTCVIILSGGNLSTTYPSLVQNCILSGGVGISAPTNNGQITQSYNVINAGTTLTNVASSATTVTNALNPSNSTISKIQGWGDYPFSSPLSAIQANVNAGINTNSAAVDIYGTTWNTPSTPTIGASEFKSYTPTGSYVPTERNASTITIAPASTSQSIELYLGVTGLTFATSGLAAYYVRNQSAPVAITLVTQTPTGAWSSGGFAEISSSLVPGVYRLDVPNAAFAANASDVTIVVRGAAGTNGAVLTVNLIAAPTDAVLVRMGPFEVRADGLGASNPLDIQTGAQHGIDIQCVDNNGSGIDITSATVTAKVYNSGATLVDTYACTATYAADGRATFTIDTTVTNVPGTYTATITRTTGASDTQVFGPLRIYVRDI